MTVSQLNQLTQELLTGENDVEVSTSLIPPKT